MSINMGYCRFANTLEALRECYEALNDGEELGTSEHEDCVRLIKLCRKIVNEDGDYAYTVLGRHKQNRK